MQQFQKFETRIPSIVFATQPDFAFGKPLDTKAALKIQ